jgi:hypothetical protein
MMSALYSLSEIPISASITIDAANLLEVHETPSAESYSNGNYEQDAGSHGRRQIQGISWVESYLLEIGLVMYIVMRFQLNAFRNGIPSFWQA